MRWKIEFGGISEANPRGIYFLKFIVPISELDRLDYISVNLFRKLNDYEIDGVRVNEIVSVGSRVYTGLTEEVVQSFNVSASFADKLVEIRDIVLNVVRELNGEFDELKGKVNQIENEGEV